MTRGPVGRKKWIIDPETGPLVKQVFEQFASSMYTFNEITDYAYSIGLRSRSKKSTTGKIAKNTWCNRLRDIQYTSIFYSDGEKVVGKYEDLVTSGLFYQVQEVINERKHPQRARLDYAYSGIVKCEFCGEMLSGTHKKGITYYRCGKRKLPCKGVKRAYVPEKKLEDELMKAFEFLEIDQKTWKVAREYVAELNQPERINIKRQVMGLTGQIRTEKRLQNKLGRKFAEDDLTKSEYDRLKEDSYQKEASLRKTVVKCEDVAHELNELMYGFLDNIKHVTKRLRMALPENKREMVSIFCENLIWKDGKLLWDWKKPYFILAKRPKKSNVLPNPCTNIKDINIKEILESFQNVAYIGVLRQRWEEIKKITKQPSLALSTV
ncbi:recombinase family protein [Patescibacteria group bacterium]|nr:recombinase family protein [Patescibacteria group bacterium]